MTPTGYITTEALHKLYNPFIDLQPALITDKKLIKAFREKHFQELTSFYKDKRNDKDAMISIISTENNGVGLFFAAKKLKKDPEVVLSAIQKDDAFPLKFASKKLRNSYDFMLKAVQKNSWVLELASEDFRDNEVIVLAAIQKQPYALQYASKRLKIKLKSNYDFMLKSVRLDPWLLQYASEDLKKIKPMALAAVKKNSLARLFVIHENFKNDPDIKAATAR